jgi:hypothetical protein
VDEVANELGALMKAKPPTSFKEAIKLLSLALERGQKQVMTDPFMPDSLALQTEEQK